MSIRMTFHQWRAQRILAKFFRHVNKASRARKIGERNFGANIDIPAIERNNPLRYRWLTFFRDIRVVCMRNQREHEERKQE